MTTRDTHHDTLPTDAELRRAGSQIPHDIPPQRDLWPAIAAAIAQLPREGQAPARPHSALQPGLLAAAASLAAAALLVLVSLDPPQPQQVVQGLPETHEAHRMGPVFVQTRDELRAVLDARLDRLSAPTRSVIQSNLDQIDRSLAAIDEALAVEPGNQSLHQLFAQTSRQQLRLLQRLYKITGTVPEGVDI